MPRKTIRGGQMDLAAQWKTRPVWLESSWEKCRSNNWHWSRVDKHELCQLDVSTMPCGLETLSINILKLYQRCHCACARRSGRSSHVMLQQIFVFSPTCCITFRKDTFDFSYKMSSKKSKGVKVSAAAHGLPLLNESICNRSMLRRGECFGKTKAPLKSIG